MALQLSRKLPSNVTGTYFRIMLLSFDVIGGTANVVVGLYLDSTNFNAGSDPVQVFTHSLPININTAAPALLTALYTQLSNLPAFAGSAVVA